MNRVSVGVGSIRMSIRVVFGCFKGQFLVMIISCLNIIVPMTSLCFINSKC